MPKDNQDPCDDRIDDTPDCAETVQLAALVRRHGALRRAMARIDKADEADQLDMICRLLQPEALRAVGVPLPANAATDFGVEDLPDDTAAKVRICPVITFGIPPLSVSIPLECRDVDIPNPFD
ncbi:MAG: hypothetical protein AAGA70_02465 [Pseudomonadota bacterium]